MSNRKPRNPQPAGTTSRTVPVDDDLVRRAGAILGTRSDTETVATALALIIFRDEVTRGIRRMAGSNSMRDIYEAEG